MTPLIIAALTALKSPHEITRVLSIPATPYIQNFSIAFERMGGASRIPWRSVISSLMRRLLSLRGHLRIPRLF
jgi:ABC-type glycerol-3-phosphate transport system permease component